MKYVIRESMYLDGEYHEASNHAPKVVEVHEKWKPHLNPKLEPYRGQEVVSGKLLPHYAELGGEPVPTSMEMQSEPAESRGKGKRAADRDPI